MREWGGGGGEFCSNIAGFHTGFFAWGEDIYWCINEARKCERTGLG